MTEKAETVEHLASAIVDVEEQVIAKMSEINVAIGEMNVLTARRHDLHERYAAELKANDPGAKAVA